MRVRGKRGNEQEKYPAVKSVTKGSSQTHLKEKMRKLVKNNGVSSQMSWKTDTK
jgi:hypothetical protein